jgi:hypothetical protein
MEGVTGRMGLYGFGESSLVERLSDVRDARDD